MPVADPASAPPDPGGPAGRDPSAPWGFRRKVHFVFVPAAGGRGLTMGHYRRGSRTVVPVEECPVHAEQGNGVAFAVRDALAAAGVAGASADLSHGPARHLVVRVARRSTETMATLVVTRNERALRVAVRRLMAGADAPHSLHLNLHDRPGPLLFGRRTQTLHGPARLREEVAGVSFLVSPTAFFQTNIEAADTLVRLVLAAVPSGPCRVLDLYAGAGLFSLPLARGGHDVTAVEEDREAVEDGRASQRLSRIAPGACRFIVARAEDAAGEVSARHGSRSRPDWVVLDPPRAGCPPGVLRGVFGLMRPQGAVYVSCNPEALARELPEIDRAGYGVDLVQPVDMFPHTTHIETVTVLSRRP